MKQNEQFLRFLSEELDISEEEYIKAEKRYKNLAEWLQRPNSTIRFLNPDIHPQGSIALGTVIRPIDNSADYDIDLVCLGEADLLDMPQKRLKDLVGDEVTLYAKVHSMNKAPEEGRRNWKLEYADGAQFHMDILPSLKDPERFKQKLLHEGIIGYEDSSEKAIAITDMEHYAYSIFSRDWPSSNPLGYRDWFNTQMKTARTMLTESLAMSLNASVEEIPAHKVKTPLQRVVQILKRHRDIMFVDDQENKPISIIITTLAAYLYNNETSLMKAMRSIVFNMESAIEERHGMKWIPNPVNPLENFADKWEEYPEREQNFYDWIERVKEDFNAISTNEDISVIGGLLKESFGSDIVNNVARRQGVDFSPVRTQQITQFVPHREDLRWPFEARHQVSLTARFSSRGFKYESFKSGQPLKKGLSLLFQVHTDAPRRNRRFYWQVVNRGTEAANASSLRGEIFNGTIEKGRSTRTESTSYTGSHWVECFVVIDGKCVGRSGEFLVNIE